MNKVILTKLALSGVALFLLFLGNQCTHEYLENVNPVCFESEVLPIFQSNCTQSGCHNATDREKGYDLSNYEGIVKKGIKPGNYQSSEMYRVLVSSIERMPKSPYNRLTDNQIEIIALWIEQGAQNTTNCASVSCDTTNVTFSGSVKPVLDTYCNGCHSGSAPSGDIDLTSWDKVMPSVNNGSLVGSVEYASGFSPMPDGGDQLSSCNIAIIKKWVALGAKND